MTQRAKLDLPVNKPVEVELLYDEPVAGSSQYGKYHMYAVRSEGLEYSFFAPEEVNDELKSLHKGDKAVITKLTSQRGNKQITTYEVKAAGANENNPSDDSTSRVGDNYFDMMLQSYKDGLEISKELNGMADPEKIAVTLFIARSKRNNY